MDQNVEEKQCQLAQAIRFSDKLRAELLRNQGPCRNQTDFRHEYLDLEDRENQGHRL